MRNLKALLVLALLAAIVVTAALLYPQQTEQGISGSGEAVLPNLAQQMGELQQIVVARAGGETVTLQRAGDNWTVVEKGGYPADMAQVRTLLVGLADLRRIEPKTAKPERYADLGLSDPDTEDSRAVAVQLRGEGGNPIANLVFGDRQPARADPIRTEIYLRQPDEPQTWLVEGHLPELGGALGWLQSDVLNLDRERIRAATVAHADGETVRLLRDDAAKMDFTLQKIPQGRETASQFTINAVADAFSQLEIDDVGTAGEVEFPEQPELTATVETFDALTVIAEIAQQDQRWLLRLRAQADPSTATADEPATPADSAPNEGAEDEEEQAAAQTETEDESSPVSERPDVEAEAEQLNARWDGWIYEPSTGWIDSVNKRMDDLLEPVADAPANEPEG